MNIQYRNTPLFLDSVPPAWTDGELVNGNTAIQISAGVYLSVQPDGSFQTRTVIGPWETCTLDSGSNLVKFAGTGVCYPVPIRGR